MGLPGRRKDEDARHDVSLGQWVWVTSRACRGRGSTRTRVKRGDDVSYVSECWSACFCQVRGLHALSGRDNNVSERRLARICQAGGLP